MTGARTAGDTLLDGGGGIAGQQGHLLGDGIGGARLLGQATPAAQEIEHTVVDLLQDLGDLRVRRRRHRMKHRGRRRGGPSEHRVEHEGVQVHVHIQGRAEPLDDGHGPAVALADTLAPGGTAQPPEDHPDEHCQHVPTQGGVESELIAQRPRQRQHPLAHGGVRNHAIDEVSGELTHAAAPTRRAEAAPLATEGHDHFVLAPLAPHMKTPVSEEATAQVGAELAGDERWEPAALLRGPSQERVEMGVDDPIEYGALGSATLVGR